MQLQIRHETTYRYTAPAYYSIQLLRLTPRSEPHQRVLDWSIHAPGRLARAVDAYGNTTHTLVVQGAHDLIHVVVSGTLEVAPLGGGRMPEGHHGSTLSPLVYTVPTALTEPAEPVRAFAADKLRAATRGSDFVGFAEAICAAVEYQPGATEVTSAAADALRIGRGVCQDHAHLFVACCRARGIPARYVSGYFHSGETEQAASHAWADVWLENEGWVSIDVTHRGFADERHCRLAVGRDYLSAAPVRGVRTGGGEESLKVDVAVRTPDQ
jgi:transglutaminase-like putative cysteine protease